MKLEFRGLAFIGPDSERALRAVVAAGAQNRAWNLIDLLYRNQGRENSGWFSDSLLRSAAGEVDGLDLGSLLAARSSATTASWMRTWALQARDAMGGRIRTPTFELGRAGEPLRLLPIQSMDVSAFARALDQLLTG